MLTPVIIGFGINYFALGAFLAAWEVLVRLFAMPKPLVPPPTVIAANIADGSFRINGDAGPPRRVVLPLKLIVRGSGELRPELAVSSWEPRAISAGDA